MIVQLLPEIMRLHVFIEFNVFLALDGGDSYSLNNYQGF